MTLLQLLQLIEGDDTRPQSIYKVTLCFMAEDETWTTVSTYSEILVPWYDCKVKRINPDPYHDDSICVWLDDTEYLLSREPQYCIRKEDPDEHMG